jgi:hypothetical protein
VPRLTLKSSSPDRMNDSTSRLRATGSTRTTSSATSSSNRSWYRLNRKNQLSSATVSGTVPCSGHQPSTSSAGA